MRFIVAAVFLLCLQPATAQGIALPAVALDSDHDRLSDSLEDALLAQFQPHFMVSREDCSIRPAQFAPFDRIPRPIADDGTIYAQAFPRKGHDGEIELHYYHLWRKDCGEMGHSLDAEHVSVLLEQGNGDDANNWKARYWYAAAHEDTVCDASQITRATTIDAETHGAQVWISAGKHASFLEEQLCKYGCGGDRCIEMEALPIARLINLGEASFPANGAIWLKSAEWPLVDKLQRSDFTDGRRARLEHLPETDIAWANPAKRPMQAAVLGGNAGVGGAATGTRAADTALVIADNQTGSALHTAAHNTGNALTNSYRNVWKALDTATKKTGEALGDKPND
jgi:hypothetical protein